MEDPSLPCKSNTILCMTKSYSYNNDGNIKDHEDEKNDDEDEEKDGDEGEDEEKDEEDKEDKDEGDNDGMDDADDDKGMSVDLSLSLFH